MTNRSEFQESLAAGTRGTNLAFRTVDREETSEGLANLQGSSYNLVNT
jgi:hypothetical protein